MNRVYQIQAQEIKLRQDQPLGANEEFKRQRRLRHYTPLMWEPKDVAELKQELKQESKQDVEVKKSGRCVIL